MEIVLDNGQVLRKSLDVESEMEKDGIKVITDSLQNMTYTAIASIKYHYKIAPYDQINPDKE